MPPTRTATAPVPRSAVRRDARAGDGAVADPGPDAVRALAAVHALGQWHATVDASRASLEWCSDALTAAYPQWRRGAELEQIACAFPGVAALGDPSEAPARESVVTAPDGRPLRLQAAADTAGRLHLRLSDLWADGESASRHLSDRERLLFVSRTMSVGEMASILAHELNQPIGSIANVLRGISLRIERGATDPDTLRPAIARGIEQVMYAAGILARVREYVEPRQPRREEIALPALVGAAIALLDWEVRRDGISVSLVDRTGPPPCVVAGDPVMLQQVVVNLARNAIEAMRGVPAARRRLDVTTVRDEDMVVLRLADRGHGIDPLTQDRLFTPFFTTKPDGTGLGLHVCRSIVELHQGRLWFDSGTADGCTVCVALPALVPDPAPETPR